MQPQLLSDVSCSYSLGAVVAGRYTLQQKVGSGSFATVYLVIDSKSKDKEEKKVLKRIIVEELRGDDTVQSAKEAQLLSRLDHPAIVHFYTSFVELQSFCIITEYCEGGDLDSRIKGRWDMGRLFPEGQVLEWLIQILLGVQYLHERLILHRDLKTKNIFLKNGMIKIGDFGVSRILASTLDCASTFTGTPNYMSPDIFTGAGYDAKSDIWSVGCVMYELASLTKAFDATSWVKLVHKIALGPSPTLPASFSTQLDDVLQRMLQKDSANRPSATEILKSPFIEESVKGLVYTLGDLLHREDGYSISAESAQIAAALEQKVHLDSLQAAAQAQRLDPRGRRRLRQTKDPKFGKVHKVVNQLYQQNNRKAVKSSDLPDIQQLDKDSQVSHGGTEEGKSQDEPHMGCLECSGEEGNSEGSEDEFNTDSEEMAETLIGSMSALSEEQSCTLRAYQNCLVRFLESSTTDDEQANTLSQANHKKQDEMVNSCIDSKIKALEQTCEQQLGEEVIQQVYSYLSSEEGLASETQPSWIEDPQHCLTIQQLLFLKQQQAAHSHTKQAWI